MQSPAQLLPLTEGGIISLQLMMIYQPKNDSMHRIVWYGGESTMLHYEKKVAGEMSTWKEQAVQTLGGGLPTQVKQLYQDMQEFYDACMTLEYDNLHATIF